MTVCMEDGLDLVRALRSLPQRERAALLLYINHGTLDDVASLYAMSRAGAGFIVQRALGRMRMWLEQPAPALRKQALTYAACRRAQLAAAARVPPPVIKPMRDAPVFCTYPHCSMPEKPVRSGSMHNVCRADLTKRAQLRWREGTAA